MRTVMEPIVCDRGGETGRAVYEVTSICGSRCEPATEERVLIRSYGASPRDPCVPIGTPRE